MRGKVLEWSIVLLIVVAIAIMTGETSVIPKVFLKLLFLGLVALVVRAVGHIGHKRDDEGQNSEGKASD